MTLSELYKAIGGDYELALRHLRVEKLVDKHIRKFSQNGVIEAVLAAGEDMDPARMFDTAHAAKGVCGNLGLTGLYEISSELSDEFRPGKARQMTDGQVGEKLREADELYKKTVEGIRLYTEENA